MGAETRSGCAPTVAGAVWLTVALAMAMAMVLSPAVWNGFPILQYDTGGYLARWYEGYLVPSRSTVFGVFLVACSGLDFWPAVLIAAAATVWILMAVFRALGLPRSGGAAVFVAAGLCAFSALPWLATTLLTDIYAGLGIIAVFLLMVRQGGPGRLESWALVGLIAFAAASHTATLAVLVSVLAGGVIALLMRAPVSARGLGRGAGGIVLGVALLLSANFALSGAVRWTPGGYGLAFGRMLQDGLVGRYLKEHCPDPRLRLCAFQDALPATADDFLWGEGVFNALGRFAGLSDEMGLIVRESLAAYPADQLRAAAVATAVQLTMAASGEGVHDKLWHTYGIVERFMPDKLAAMRAARQQRGELGFDSLNRLQAPVIWLSLLFVPLVAFRAAVRRRWEAICVLAFLVMVAVIANAVVCAVMSGPHDRYGARVAWLAVLVVLARLVRAEDATRRARAGAAAAPPTGAGVPALVRLDRSTGRKTVTRP